MAPPNGPSSTYGRPRQIVAAPTHTAEWVALYTYTSSAALYSQLPICEAALAPISARAAGTARTSRYARTIRSPIPRGYGFLRDGCQGPGRAVVDHGGATCGGPNLWGWDPEGGHDVHRAC